MKWVEIGTDVEQAEKYGFDFDSYGHDLMRSQGRHMTDYGMVIRARQPEMRMTMAPEQSQTMEPTLGM